MSSMGSSSALVFLNLLADRKLKPAGVLLRFNSEFGGSSAAESDNNPGDAFSTLASRPEFITFAAGFPCFIATADAQRLPPETLQAMQGAGCQVLADDILVRASNPAAGITENRTPAAPALPPAALWLAGDWYMAPPAKPPGNPTASRTLALKLVQLVAADADTHEIEAIFRQDPTLSYHLLRLVNSLGMSTNKRITSFSQAILILGRQQLRRWLNLMLFAARKDDQRAAMLLAHVAVRARNMELLARASGLDRAGQELSFMAGMFSLLGILFGLPLPEILKPLQISEVLVDAVLRREGDIGRLLQAVEFAEQGDSVGLSGLLDALSLSAAQFNLLNIEACQWMLDIVRETQGGAHG